MTVAQQHALQTLVRDRLEQLGRSYGEAARRGAIPRSTVHHLATTDRIARMPQATTLEGLARALDLPVHSIRRAAAESCGIHIYEPVAGRTADPVVDRRAGQAADPAAELLMASLQRLSAQDRRHVAALVESLLTRPDDSQGSDSQGSDGEGSDAG